MDLKRLAQNQQWSLTSQVDLALGLSYMAPLDKEAVTSFDSKYGTWLLMNGARHDVDSGVEISVINGL